MINFEDLASRVKYHIQTNYLTQSEIKKIYEDVPVARYEGSAHRSVVHNSQISDLPGKNLYWSKSLEGVKNYLNNSYKSQPNFHHLQADVKGVDLNLLIQEINHHCPDKDPIVNPYAGEEEILVVEISNWRITQG